MKNSRKNRGGASSSSSSSSSPTRPPRENRPLTPRSLSSLLLPPTPPPLHVTIRFSTSLPDLHLDVPSPQQTTVVALKHLIRARLSADAGANQDAIPSSTDPTSQASRARLRFIHNGRILPDASVLSAVLKAPPPPPLPHHQLDPKGKSIAGAPQQQRAFINCSIGDALSETDLSAEASPAAAPPPSPISSHPTTPSRTPPPRLTIPTSSTSSLTNLPSSTTLLPPSSISHSHYPPHPQSPSQQPNAHSQQPLGFDRLLQAGLTPSEISTLRSHFRAIHTARFTPDTMPLPDALRAMEDAWLDRSGPEAGSIPSYDTAGHGGGFAGEGGEEGAGGAGIGGTEDVYGLSAVAGPLIRGMMIGFLFPLGVVGWLGKEDGVCSQRMLDFVTFGVLLSVSVGVMRGLTEEA